MGKVPFTACDFIRRGHFAQTGGSPKRISWIPFPQSLRKSCRCCGHRRRIHYVLCTGRWHRWTEETFRFAAPAGPATSAVSAVPVDIDGVLIYEVEQYPTLQDAFDAHSISEPLAPSWIPEGYVLDYVEASPSTGQVVFTASYSSGQSILNLMYSYRMDGTFSSSIFEKDGSSVIEYTKNGIVHYIMSNVNVRVAAWVNGTCECSITGPLTEQEMITIIDSIYT